MRFLRDIVISAVLCLVAGTNHSWSMEPATDNETCAMTFVFGTDLNYRRPTLVSIYSLLKNGIPKKEQRWRRINVLILSDGLSEEDKKNFCSSVYRIVEKLHKNMGESHKDVYLFFLDTENDQLKQWAKDLKFGGRNLPEHLTHKVKGYMQTRKAVLPFYIASHKNGNISCEYAEPSQDKIDIKKVSLNIKHYMWLDSDVLIAKDITELYSKCRDNTIDGETIKGGIYCVNYYFINGDITDSEKHTDPRQYTDFKAVINPRASNSWRCSGGVMFFNIFSGDTPLFDHESYLEEIQAGQEIKETQLQLKDEEEFYSQIASQYCPPIIALPPKYNCRPAMPEFDRTDSSIKDLLKDDDVVVWHWDSMPKPWKFENLNDVHSNEKEIKWYRNLVANRKWNEIVAEMRRDNLLDTISFNVQDDDIKSIKKIYTNLNKKVNAHTQSSNCYIY